MKKEEKSLKEVLIESRYKIYSSLLDTCEHEKFVQKAYDMTEKNIKSFYDNSTSTKWNYEAKRQELLRCHQIVIQVNEDLIAFASISLEGEIEDDCESEEVIYLYELQVKNDYQSLGHGKRLLDEVLVIARRMHCSQVMLTVFKSNSRACQFYQRHGFTEHWSSPTDTDYFILTKRLEEE